MHIGRCQKLLQPGLLSGAKVPFELIADGVDLFGEREIGGGIGHDGRSQTRIQRDLAATSQNGRRPSANIGRRGLGWAEAGV